MGNVALALGAAESPARSVAAPRPSVLARLAVVASTLTIAIAAVGALAVRPIADDLDINGKLVAFHGAVPAFQSWMQTWTGYYSE